MTAIKIKKPVRYGQNTSFKELWRESTCPSTNFFVKYRDERITIEFSGEVDIVDWVKKTSTPIIPGYKIDLIIDTPHGKQYLLKGCWPMRVNGNRVSVIFDRMKEL